MFTIRELAAFKIQIQDLFPQLFCWGTFHLYFQSSFCANKTHLFLNGFKFARARVVISFSYCSNKHTITLSLKVQMAVLENVYAKDKSE